MSKSILNEPIKKGAPIEAAFWEEIRQVALRYSNFSVSSPLELVATGGGTALRVKQTASDGMWIKINSGGTSGKYAWTEQIPATGGTWEDGDKTGTTTTMPAIEINGNTTITAGTRVWARMDPTLTAYHFVFSKCS